MGNKRSKKYGYLFKKCKSLKSLSQFKSKWDTSKVTNFEEMFYNCSSLTSMVNFSKWNVENVQTMNGMFYGCKNIKKFPNFKEWNIIKLEDISNMFFKCKSLENLSFVHNWEKMKVSKIKKKKKEVCLGSVGNYIYFIN